MASLTKRIVVRISDDLDQWISEQAENEDLDSATWVRATLRRVMRGGGPLVTLEDYGNSPFEAGG